MIKKESEPDDPIEMIGMEKNRLDKASKELKKSINRIIKALQKELESIDEILDLSKIESGKMSEDS